MSEPGDELLMEINSDLFITKTHQPGDVYIETFVAV